MERADGVGLVMRMGEGKSRWWWKSLKRRTRLGILVTGGKGGEIERSLGGGGESAKFRSEFEGKQLDRFEQVGECGRGGVPEGKAVLEVWADKGSVEVDDGVWGGVMVELTKD